MANEGKNIFIIILIVLVVMGIGYSYSKNPDFFKNLLGVILPSVFQPETKFLTQYAGNLPLCCGYAWLATHPYSVSQNMEAVIKDYKIVTEKFDSGTITQFNGCKSNSCNGAYKRTDEYGCDIWYGNIGTLECGSDHAYQCSCFTQPDWQVCGDRMVECRKSGCGCPMTKQTFDCYNSCGGANLQVIQSGEGCYSSHKVYYKNNLIYETPLIYSVLIRDFREGIIVPDSSIADLHIDFQKEALYFSSPYDWQGGHASKGCSAVINDIIFKIPPNAFTFDIDIPERQLIAGENVTAEINIINNWMDTSGRLDLLVNIPYKVFGEQKQTSDELKKFIDVKKGSNTFYFNLPTEQVTNMIYVTPTFYLLLEGNNFKGVNFYCFEQGNTKERDISSCEYVSFGTLSGDKFKLDVVPPVGYNESIIINLEEQIRQLELTSVEQAKLINDLDLTISEQAEIIKAMQSKVEEQATIVNNLELTLAQQASLIDALNLKVDEQLVILNNLNLNLAQKQELVNQLEITNEEQQFLISQMRGSFAEQAGIIRELNLTIEDDAELIKEYKLSLEGQAGIISELRLTIDEMIELIDKLELSETDLTTLVNSLKLTILEKEEIIAKLKLTITPLNVTTTPTTIPPKKTNWWVYGGIAGLVIFLIFLLSKKR